MLPKEGRWGKIAGGFSTASLALTGGVMADQSKSLDVLGLRPLSEATLHLAKATVDGAAAFLGRVCLPAAEELGLLLRDKVSAWRSTNAAAILNSAERKLEADIDGRLNIHPRLVYSALDHGSWSDDQLLHEMWGGILAASAAEDPNDGNLTYVNVLAQMTASQARLLAWACEQCSKRVSSSGLIESVGPLPAEPGTLYEISGLTDLHLLDVELDRLRGLGLIEAGFSYMEMSADMLPTSLGLNLYARCQGWPGNAVDYFQLGK